MLLPNGRIPHRTPCQRGGICGTFIGCGGRYPVFAPNGDRIVFKMIHRAPARKKQEWIIIGIPHENPLQSVVVCMHQHGAKRVEVRVRQNTWNW